jgi:Rrf2 family cysteine metabolism transcriptional repressor
MRISAKAEYACLAIIELAKPGPKNGSYKPVREIAALQGIPERYLMQILLELKAAGLVQSARGSVGGYYLNRPAEEVSIADIIAAIDGCGGPPRTVSSPDADELAEVLRRAWSAEQDVLASATIARFSGPLSMHNWMC